MISLTISLFWQGPFLAWCDWAMTRCRETVPTAGFWCLWSLMFSAGYSSTHFPSHQIWNSKQKWFFVYNVLIKKQNKLWPSYDKNLILLSYFNKTCQVYSLIYWRPKYNTNTQYLSHNGAHWSHIVANIGSAQCLVYGLIKLLSSNTHSMKILVTNPNIV